MNKKAQVTIFIILGIVLIASFLFIFSLKGNIIDFLSQSNIPPEIQGVYDFTQDCLRSTSEEAIYLIGQQGGYYKTPNPKTTFEIPYYIYNNKSNILKKEGIIGEISLYINEALPLCTDNFTNFPEFNILQKDVVSKVDLKKDKIMIKVEYPLNIKKGDISYQLKEFNTELNFRLNIIYETIEFIINKQLEDTGNICLTCLLDFGAKNDIFINMRLNGNNTIIYNLVDPNSLLDIKIYSPELYGYGQYNYIFAIQY